MSKTGDYRAEWRSRRKRPGNYCAFNVRYLTDARSLQPEDTLDALFSGLTVSFDSKRFVTGFANFIRRISRRDAEARSVLLSDVALRRAHVLRHAYSKQHTLRPLFSEPLASLVWKFRRPRAGSITR